MLQWLCTALIPLVIETESRFWSGQQSSIKIIRARQLEHTARTFLAGHEPICW
jgi:hypothetical protein